MMLHNKCCLKFIFILYIIKLHNYKYYQDKKNVPNLDS